MIGSPNYFIGVYDADESSYTARPVAVTRRVDRHRGRLRVVLHARRSSPTTTREFSGRSDYQAFINNDIPSSGLFTGAEVLKTAEQAAIWGGTVGAQFDPCYHPACDTYANNAEHALDVNTDAIAFAVLTFAYSTESVNGVPGQRVPGSQAAADAGRSRGHVPGGNRHRPASCSELTQDTTLGDERARHAHRSAVVRRARHRPRRARRDVGR